MVIYFLVARFLLVQNLLILIGSFIFYGSWNIKYLILLVISCSSQYVAGILLGRIENPFKRKLILWLSIILNIGILAVFKYYGFFRDSFQLLMGVLGVNVNLFVLDVLLPIGVSFYTFQALAYTIDIYCKRLSPEKNLIIFFAFVSFFPQLVAGPIERGQDLLPQFHKPRIISFLVCREALWLLLWGFFLKVVVSDSMSQLTNWSFHQNQASGTFVMLGTIAFGVQIYTDFNGYSTIARGLALLLGFNLKWNFNLPYFATSIQEFWRRWHITLSLWLRDYVYIPLGGNRKGKNRAYVNILITMLLGGLWHGAGWSFIFWGGLHGIAIILDKVLSKTKMSKAPVFLKWIATMSVVFIGWFFFRAQTWELLRGMSSALVLFDWSRQHTLFLISMVTLALPVVVVELYQYRKKSLLAPLHFPSLPFAILGGGLLTLIVVMFDRYENTFIYFQF